MSLENKEKHIKRITDNISYSAKKIEGKFRYRGYLLSDAEIKKIASELISIEKKMKTIRQRLE